MEKDEIRGYWDVRAAADSTAQSTTQDVYLREIEFRTLLARIPKYSVGTVGDVGCGDGRTTTRLAEAMPTLTFEGIDYSPAMIENARKVNDVDARTNLSFRLGDITEGPPRQYDLIFTTRCLINLPSWELQARALNNIHGALKDKGVYLMIENFVEGQHLFNEVRKAYGLAPIAIREHNLFFERSRLLGFLGDLFEIDEEVNISSTYYLVTRVIYSRLCLDRGVEPDYFDRHHVLAAGLPYAGEYGPVRLLALRRRSDGKA